MLPNYESNTKQEDQFQSLQKSSWICISNLDDDVTEPLLTEHIKKECKFKPKFIEIRSHPTNDYPPFARVRMPHVKAAKNVIAELQMSLFEGEKLWIQQCR